MTHQVEAVGICAGDAKTFTGAERFWGRSSFDLINFVSLILNSFNDHSRFLRIKTFFNTGNGADVPQYVEPPVIPGHEFSGRVRLYLFTETGKFSFSNWC